jgi:ribonuclease P protein component
MLRAVDNKLKNTFRKQDKLKSSLAIETLYHANQFLVSYPLKCYFLFSELTETQSSVRVAFSVPKKSFKNAVQRNSLKRRMREAYRLNYKKVFETFVNQKDKQLQILFIFIGKEIVDYGCIEKNMQTILMKLNEKMIDKL